MSAVSLYAKPSANFAQKLVASKLLLISAAEQYQPITQASSLGAEDMVVTHLIAETAIPASIFVLDTRMLHAQTLELIGKLQARYNVTVDVYQPNATTAEQFIATHGEGAMYKSLDLRKACCDFRKMEPLARALQGKQAWITGLRREQSNARADVPDIEQTGGRAKFNPLAGWTQGDVWHFIATRNVPYNPLHDAFFPSIGCAPCTRAVTLGEDPRSGRWWWESENAKECGLHVDAAGAAQEPAAFESLSKITITEMPA